MTDSTKKHVNSKEQIEISPIFKNCDESLSFFVFEASSNATISIILSPINALGSTRSRPNTEISILSKSFPISTFTDFYL